MRSSNAFFSFLVASSIGLPMESVAGAVIFRSSSATDSIGKPIEEATKKEKNAFEERISNYLKKKSAKNFSTVCVQNIQNIFSPEYPDKKRVLAAVDNLGYTWKKDSWGAEFVML